MQKAAPEEKEVPLEGGRVTVGVVRIGTTVRRPQGKHSPFVHALLQHLETAGFSEAPRYFGEDEQGREILSFMPGEVPCDLSDEWTDAQLATAVRLIRRFHDATSGTPLAGREEVVCHMTSAPAISSS